MKATLKKIQTAYGVDEYQLSNGLRVLYKKVTAAPVVAVCITYHVGSRNEAKGHTGSTHILEHLLFKDSEHFNKANGKGITNYLEWFGAYMNATTWLDRTNYFEMLPNQNLEEALAVEADRMRSIRFTAADLESEMTVVRNEYERSRNNPFELIDEAIMEKAFVKHPYRIPTIGTKEDIEASNTKKLYEFYNTFYWPNNATLMIAGDVTFSTVQKLVLKYFGPLTRSPHKIPQLSVVEPLQEVSRAVTIRKPMGVSIVELMYKTERGRDTEYPALYVAAMILAGGFSNRLQKALVDTGLAAGISTMPYALYDPGVITFTAQVANKTQEKLVCDVMRKTILNFSKEGPLPEELIRAKERTLAHAASERDGVLKEIRTVSEALAAGDWTLAYRLEQEVGALTISDVARVAQKYFTTAGETSGILYNSS